MVSSSGVQPFRRMLVSQLRDWVHAPFRSIYRDQSGATAIEFALISGILVYLLLNGIDLGRYIYLRSQVENATQAGAHSIWEKCDPMKLPIVPQCYPNQPAAKTAVGSVISSIVKGVADDHVIMEENYYCSDVAGALHLVTNPARLPAQCFSEVVPGDYVKVQVTYPFTPLFSNLTIVGTFGNAITTTSYMRLQ